MALNQTISFLIERFREVGLRPDSRRGQNFLIDRNLQELLVRTAELEPDDVVLEVGTGTGALTELMAEQAAAVVTVEVDQHLYEMARGLLANSANVVMLLQDVLKNKNHFDPRVLEAVAEQMAAHGAERFKLVSNLPYSVATPVLSNLLACEVPPKTMTATIQKELADRITARPSTKDYSALSIWMQSQCQIQIVRVLPPSVFWPRPQVTSAILHIIVDDALRQRIPDRHYFHQFVRAMFIHRRKFLRSNLLGAMKKYLSKPDVDQVMELMGLGPETRAEQLDVDTMLALSETVRQAAPDWHL